jgi:hypothetical protein
MVNSVEDAPCRDVCEGHACVTVMSVGGVGGGAPCRDICEGRACFPGREDGASVALTGDVLKSEMLLFCASRTPAPAPAPVPAPSEPSSGMLRFFVSCDTSSSTWGAWASAVGRRRLPSTYGRLPSTHGRNLWWDGKSGLEASYYECRMATLQAEQRRELNDICECKKVLSKNGHRAQLDAVGSVTVLNHFCCLV